MADMSKCPRNSVELCSHESVMAEEQTFEPLTLAKKSLTLTKSVAVVLAVCALLVIGVLGVAVLQVSKKSGSERDWSDITVSCFNLCEEGYMQRDHASWLPWTDSYTMVDSNCNMQHAKCNMPLPRELTEKQITEMWVDKCYMPFQFWWKDDVCDELGGRPVRGRPVRCCGAEDDSEDDSEDDPFWYGLLP